MSRCAASSSIRSGAIVRSESPSARRARRRSPPAPRRCRQPRRGGGGAMSIVSVSWPRVIARYTSARSCASSSAPCTERCALSTPNRSHSASRLLRLPGNISRASASVSITLGVDVRARAEATPARSSASRKPTSNGALWMIHSAPRAKVDELGGDVAESAACPLRSSHVMPWTSVAPASISRSGSSRKWTERPVARRSTTSSAASSMIRWPCFGIESGGLGVDDDLAHAGGAAARGAVSDHARRRRGDAARGE